MFRGLTVRLRLFTFHDFVLGLGYNKPIDLLAVFSRHDPLREGGGGRVVYITGRVRFLLKVENCLVSNIFFQGDYSTTPFSLETRGGDVSDSSTMGVALEWRMIHYTVTFLPRSTAGMSLP